MAELNVQQKNIVNQLRQAYPELKTYSDEQILSLYNEQLNDIQLSEDERISIMNGKSDVNNDEKGLKLETSQKAVSKEQEVQLKSALTARLNAVSTNVKKAEDSNGFLGKAWSWSKNNIPFLNKITDSSDEVREQQKADLKALESGNIEEAFKSITGLDYTVENINKFLNNEVQTKSETALNGYTEGQDMASDVIADMVSGIAAVGIYTAAVAAAPFTGGASIAVGVVAAGASAAAIKTGIKYADAKSGGREYTADNLKKDLATGSFSGVIAPITGGMGGAVGKTVATKVGIQAVKQVGKEVAEEAVEQTAKGFVKTMLTNPTGYEYIGGNMVKRGLAFAAEAATDGAIGGAVDNAFRTAYDGGSLEDIGNSAVEGFVGGAIMSPVIGGGMKSVGVAFNRIKGVDDFSSLVSNCNKLDNEDLIELYKYYKTLEVESSHKGVEIPDIKKSGFEKLMQEINARGINVDDIEIKNRYLLEGNTDPNDLTEVAPFAERLDNSPQIGDIVVPNKDRLEIENGDFVNGEFVPDGSGTVYANANNPLNKKSFTWQRSSYPSFLVAQNKKELSKQIADILGEKKISLDLSKQIDEILEKNSDIKISDLSEIIGCLNNINLAKKFIENHQLKKITNFKRFKENAGNYAEFMYKLKNAELGYQANENVIEWASRFNIFDGDFVKFLEKIDSENFEANCNAYINMRGYLKNHFYTKTFLTTVQEQKVLERIQILDDFNYEYTNWSKNYGDNNKIEPFYKLDVLSDDKKFAELLERMEYCKKAKKYNQYHANQILHYGKDFECFKKFDSSIPENLKYDIYKFYNDIFTNCPENIDKFIEFCNKMPEDWFKTYFRKEYYIDTKRYEYSNREEICNLFMNFGAKCYEEKWYKTVENGYLVNKNYEPIHRTPDELIKRIDLLNKVEHLLKYKYGKEEHIDVHVIDRILTVYDIKDIDKAMLFLNTADENYLRLIKLDNYHSGDSNTNYDLYKLINSENLDNMIENARVYNELSVDIRELFAKKAGRNFDIKFDIPTEDFKARIDIIKKYGEILDDDNLIKIFKGESNNIKAFERFAQLPKELKEQFQSVYSNYNIECLGILNDTGYQKFVSLISEIKFKPDEFQNVFWNLNNNKILFEELSFEELNTINPRFFTDDWGYPEIDVIRKRISQIPERMRSYIKYADEFCELMKCYSLWFDTKNESAQRVMAAIQQLNTLSDRDLNNIGAKGLNRFLDESKYHLADGATFPKEKLEQLNQLPQGILERLQKHNNAIYNLLMNEGDIDVKTMISRYKLLESNGLLEDEKIGNNNFYALMIAGKDKFSVISKILASSTRKIDNINKLISVLPSDEIVRKHHDFIFDTLINNPNNDVNNISSQLNYVFNNRDGWGISDAEIEASIEFAKKVVKDLIKRGDINDGQADNKNLLSNLFNAIRTYRNDTLEFDQVKYKSLMKNIDYKGAKKSDIISLYNNINSLEHLDVMDNWFNISLPFDKIIFMLNLNISSEISPIVVAEKAKKFFDLGLDDNFIKDIFENSESLTFYSDEVLKILKQRSIDDPDTPLSYIIKTLVGNTPNNLQDRIDMLILLAKFTDDEVAVFKKQGIDVNFKIEQLEKLIDAKHDLISTTQTDINTFLKAFANTKKADDVIRNANFEQFGKNGIQLQYPREKFIKRMNELLGYDFSKEIKRSENIEIPTLKMTDEDILKSEEALKNFKARYNDTKEYNVILDGKETKITRFLNSKTAGSNDGDFAMIGDKLYYLKFPDETKLGQSVQEVMAAELYRAAGVDAPNMKIMFNSDGTILGMASEYVPSVGEVARGKNLFDSFATDAWLANWDAPKNDNSAMRNGTCIKMDVGGSLEYRARGSRKENFGNIVNELTSLIEQNNDYYSMTKADVLSSLKHVTNISDEQVWKIVENVPAEFRNYALGQKMLTRRDFIKKFETIFEQMDETKYNNILDMVNDARLQAINEFDMGSNVASLLGYEQTALGFEGLLNTRDLSNLNLKPQELATAQKMIHEIESFTKYNRVADNVLLPKEVKVFLNSILKGIPEFAAYFSKPQHNGTQYSLDVHILKVLQDSLKDPDYAKLNDQDKIVLKFSTLLHDIGKRYLGSNSDTGHAGLSSEYVYSILDRFKLSDDMKDRIISIVENHHWFKDFDNKVLNEKTIATLARRPQDWLIYKIMAKADLVNVSEKFAIDHVKGATSLDDLSQAFDKQVAAIEEQVQLLKEKQVVVTPTKWVDVPERIKANGEILEARTFGRTTAMLDGKECEFKVLNLNEITDDEDMFKYGFNHIQKKALRFIIHMPGDGSVKWFNVFKTLAKNPLNNSAQSLSMISIDDTSTYCGRQFGFILDVNNANISHAYCSNTGSGTGKGLQSFVHELFENGHHRSYVKDQFIDFLQTERGIEIDDVTYSKITEFIMSKKYPETQLINLKALTIDDKTYKMQDILDAFTFSRDQLINETKEKRHGSHNEIVGLNTKVKGIFAKVNTFEELPEYFLRFAHENNLPILLVGNK